MSDPTAGIRGAFDSYSFLVKKVFRHWYWIIIGFVVAFGGAAAFAFTRNDAYKSETLVQVDRAILTDFVEGSGVGAGDLKARITQLTLSRTRLEQVLTEFNLYPDMRTQKSIVEVLAYFRAELVIEMHGEDTFMLGFQHDDPRTAQAVTQRMAELFIQERSRTRTDRARTTARVLGEQVDALLQELGRQEDELANFKEEHASEVLLIERRRLGLVGPVPTAPTKEQTTSKRPSGPRVVITGEAGVQLGALRAKRAEKESELRALQPAVVAPNSPEAEELRGQIAQLQQERASLRARFTDDYPDVVVNAQRIAGLQRRLQSALRPVQAAQGQQSARQMQLTQEIADLDIEIARIQREATRVVRPSTNNTTAANDPTKVPPPVPVRPAVPLSIEEVETQLNHLDGQVETTRGRYQNAVARKYDADFALSVEAQQAAESVTVIDAADLPAKPFYPNRPKILGAGAGAGVVLGIVLAFLFAVLDTRIFDENDLARAVDVPVLVSIPDYRSS
jgi:uncharacterized protein involved in exopolysaccharide biosynthesis